LILPFYQKKKAKGKRPADFLKAIQKLFIATLIQLFAASPEFEIDS
jgi:hypothetical protein